MAHPELERLCDYCVTAARMALANERELAPFAAAIRRGGALVTVVANVPEGAEISAPRLADLLTGGLRELALCYDGLVSSEDDPDRKKDAIIVGLEHVDGESVDICVPYRKRKLLGYSFGEWTAVERVRSLFANTPPGSV
jgi:hypothetical protein